MTEGIVRSLGIGRFLGWEALDAMGSAGGVLVVWDKRSLDLLDKEMSSFSVSCRFINVENGFVWVFWCLCSLNQRRQIPFLGRTERHQRALGRSLVYWGGLQCYPLPLGAKQTGKIDSINETILKLY